MSLLDEDEPVPVPDWVLTYGDMMSLLLCFFILLVAMAEIKQNKYEAMVESLRRSFGQNASPQSPLPRSHWMKGTGISTLRSQAKAKPGGEAKGGEEVDAPRGQHPKTLIIRPGRNPTLGGVIYFDETSSELSPQNRDVLQRTAALFRGKPQKVEIRGHTSTFPLPPDSPYSNHWDLAYARCIHTMEYLVQLGVDAKRLRVSIAAGNEPLHQSPDPLLRKENSRVEIFMLDEFIDNWNDPKGGN